MGLGGGWFLDSLLNCVRDGRVVWLKGILKERIEEFRWVGMAFSKGKGRGSGLWIIYI